jgi:hypothetical protein
MIKYLEGIFFFLLKLNIHWCIGARQVASSESIGALKKAILKRNLA